MLIQKEGFNYKFNPEACKDCNAACCSGESGYIWVSIDEMRNIAMFLNISFEEFKNKFTIKVGYRFSLKERKVSKDNYECIFLANNKCSIYPVRPMQCRTFPFWDYFKNNKEEVKKECIGIVD